MVFQMEGQLVRPIPQIRGGSRMGNCDGWNFESRGFEEPDPWWEYEGIDPAAPTDHKPGLMQKVLVLEARYASGEPLWHDSDESIVANEQERQVERREMGLSNIGGYHRS